jgi:Fic family protein
MALMHYQFEAIHPFTDGNGRTGRILNILFLIERKLLESPVLYLSRYILERRNDYYRGLRLVTEEQRWEEWLLYVLSAIEETALATRAKVDSIRTLMTSWTERVKRERPGIYSKDLMEVVFRYPYCKIGFLEEAGVATRQTSSKYLKELSEMGLFHPLKRGREIYFVNAAFFDVLTE